MTHARRITAVAAAAALLALDVVAHAQSRLDIDPCARRAQAAPSAPAAPGDSPGALPGASLGGSVMTAPGSAEANRQPNASGRLSSTPGSPGTNAGAISGGGSAAPAVVQGYRDCLGR
jgi:hypothetical protein